LRKLTTLGHQGAERLSLLPDGSLYVLGGGTGVHVFKTPLQAPRPSRVTQATTPARPAPRKR
jgi:hypothetical protein